MPQAVCPVPRAHNRVQLQASQDHSSLGNVQMVQARNRMKMARIAHYSSPPSSELNLGLSAASSAVSGTTLARACRTSAKSHGSTRTRPEAAAHLLACSNLCKHESVPCLTKREQCTYAASNQISAHSWRALMVLIWQRKPSFSRSRSISTHWKTTLISL